MKADDQRPVVIVGAGRQGRNVLDVCLDLGRHVRGFLDDTLPPGRDVNGVQVIAGFGALADILAAGDAAFFVALGDITSRRDVTRRIEAQGGPLATLIHPSSPVSVSAEIGAGVYVNGCCRIRANARIETGVLIETHTGIGASATLGAFATTGPGVQLTADVEIGPGAFLGAGAVVTHRVTVGAGAVVGAGATVLSDVAPGAFVVGTPARVVDRVTPTDPSRQSDR